MANLLFGVNSITEDFNHELNKPFTIETLSSGGGGGGGGGSGGGGGGGVFAIPRLQDICKT